MSLRNIRPSSSNFSEANTSASASASASTSASASASASAPSNSTSTSESTPSDPRRPHQSGGDRDRDRRPGATPSSGSLSKRRRVPDSITRNACLNCKKARAKCDGKQPCSRCDTRSEHASCVYEVHIKHAKEELVKQITDLRAKDRQSERIYRALQSEPLATDVLKRLRNGDSQDSIAEWLQCTAPADQQDQHDGYSPFPAYLRTDSPPDQDLSHPPPMYWTTVGCGPAVIKHLFMLYFSWVHPVQTILREGHFHDSFHTQSSDFCSPLLVNAICALACALHNDHEHEALAYDDLGERFAAAFRHEFDPADKRITTVQATAVMFQLEVSRGNSSRANGYLKLATENIREAAAAPAANITHPVFKATMDGICALNVEWAQATFEPPPFLDMRSVAFGTSLDGDEDLDARPWYFYRFEHDQPPAWPSLLKTVNEQKMKLISIINDVCAIMYGPSHIKITAQHILELYARFKTWYEVLPPKLGANLENKSQALPHLVSLLILYNHSVTQLLRPLNDLPDFPPVLVKEVIASHAQRGLYLIDHQYRKHFTCRYLPSLQLFVVANLCDLVARYHPSKPSPSSSDLSGGEALLLGLDVLADAHAHGAGPPLAGVLREMLRLAPASYSAPLSIPPGAEWPVAHAKYTYEEFMDASTRAVYFQHTPGLRERFEAELPRRWLEESARFGFLRLGPGERERALRVSQGEGEQGANYLMRIKNLLNENT